LLCVGLTSVQTPTLLEAGTPIVRELSGTVEHVYQLKLEAHEYAAVNVEQRGIDVVVRVSDAAGALVMEVDGDSRTEGRELAGIAARSAANYRVTVRPRYSRAAAGSYEIRLGEIRPARDRDRDLFDAHRLSTEAATLNAAGKYSDAQERAARALELAERSLGPDDAYVGDLLVRLADLRRTNGDTATAERLLLRAVTIDRSALGRDHIQTATALLRLGALYTATEEYAKGEPVIEESLATTERVLGSVHPRVVTCLMVVSLAHSRREDYERALPELQRALAIAEATLEPSEYSVLTIVNNLGDLYSLVKDYDRAESLLTRALDGLEKLLGPNHPALAIPLQNLGTIARETKRYPRALELLWRAEAIREKTLGPRHTQTVMLLLNIGNVYNDEHDYATARENFVRALDVLETAAGPYHTLTKDALSSIGRTYAAAGDFTRALEYQARVDSIVEKNIDLNLTIGSEREKLAYFSAAMEGESRTVSLHARNAPDNPAAAALAATVIEQRKGRVLDAMAGSLTALRARMDPGDSAVLDRLTTATSQFAELALKGPGRTPFTEYQRRLTGLEQQREHLESEVTARSAEFRAQSLPVTLASLHAAIPADAALVEFALFRPFDPTAPVDTAAQFGSPRYIAYVLRRQGGVQWKELGSAEEIDRAVAELRGALRDPKRDDVAIRSREVERLVMQPISAMVSDAAHLLVSPDGELNLIPFEALVDAQGRYLVERFAVSYLTAGRDLLRLQVARSSHSEPVVVADPSFGEPPASLPRAG
jgi:tetratricopeptide (TPR) repeat protein